jgi:hypothetical protein
MTEMQLLLNAKIGMSLSKIKEFIRIRPAAINQQVPINSRKENHSPTRKPHV